MNTATKNLEDDHVHILRLIDVMEKITGYEKPDIGHIESIVDIIRNYADGLHHAKEENIFFPFIGGKGFSPVQGPVAVMLSEHVTGRNFVKKIADNIIIYKNGREEVLIDIYSDMTGYAELLRSHISKENNILFRMADRVLSADDNRKILTEFEKAERDTDSPETKNGFIVRIEKLAELYNI